MLYIFKKTEIMPTDFAMQVCNRSSSCRAISLVYQNWL